MSIKTSSKMKPIKNQKISFPEQIVRFLDKIFMFFVIVVVIGFVFAAIIYFSNNYLTPILSPHQEIVKAIINIGKYWLITLALLFPFGLFQVALHGIVLKESGIKLGPSIRYPAVAVGGNCAAILGLFYLGLSLIILYFEIKIGTSF